MKRRIFSAAPNIRFINKLIIQAIASPYNTITIYRIFDKTTYVITYFG